MARKPEQFQLPKKLERILANLCQYYGQVNQVLLKKIVANSKCVVEEGISYDNWDGGIHGHAIHLQVPSIIYFSAFDSLDSLAQQLKDGINRLGAVQDEFIDVLYLELLEDEDIGNWRESSGVLVAPSTKPAREYKPDQVQHLWHPDFFRIFFSHKAKDKQHASQLKGLLEMYGVSSFVAHEDIEPTKEWQDEIERALFSMDALVALMTEAFADSNWTDQEIGVALGRGVPIIPIRLGTDPYGFIGKYQALSGHGKSARLIAQEVYDLLWAMPSLRARLAGGILVSLENAGSFAHSNALMKYVAQIERATPEMIERLERAPEKNSQVRDAYEVKGQLPGILSKLRQSIR